MCESGWSDIFDASQCLKTSYEEPSLTLQMFSSLKEFIFDLLLPLKTRQNGTVSSRDCRPVLVMTETDVLSL